MGESVSWKFLSFVSRSGRCAIADWYDSLRENAQAAFDARLSYLAQTPLWHQNQHYTPLKGKKFKGLGEIKFKSDNTQHRVIGFTRTNREFVMLIGCTHKQQVYKPPSALETAASRMKDVLSGDSEVRDYEFECDKEKT